MKEISNSTLYKNVHLYKCENWQNKAPDKKLELTADRLELAKTQHFVLQLRLLKLKLIWYLI